MVTKLIRVWLHACIFFSQKAKPFQLRHVRIPTEHDDPEEGKDKHFLKLKAQPFFLQKLQSAILPIFQNYGYRQSAKKERLKINFMCTL